MGSLPLADVPALPLHTAGKYVAGAYVVLFALVLIYVAIMAIRMSRLERDLGELLQEADRGSRPRAPGGEDPGRGGAQEAAGSGATAGQAGGSQAETRPA